MAENKTQPTELSVAHYLAAIEDEVRRADCTALAQLMSKASGQPATMWGTGIVGFGSYHYVYDSGREGDMCLIGFAARKGDITIYGTGRAPDREALLAEMGRHKIGKGCLYVRRLADVDLKVLERLIRSALAAKA